MRTVVSRRAFLRTTTGALAGATLGTLFGCQSATGRYCVDWSSAPEGGTIELSTRTRPEGIEGEVERVAVIGAGAAGLTVARSLQLAGKEVVVLEARDRAGGRLHTASLGGTPVDMGAAWVHYPHRNPLACTMDALGVGRTDAGIEDRIFGRTRFHDPATDAIATEGQIDRALRAYDSLYGALDRVVRQSDGSTSLEEAIDLALDDLDLGDDRAFAESLIKSITEVDEAAPLSDISFLAWNEEPEEAYRGTDDFPIGGYIELVDALASGIDVRLSHAVTRVETTASGVRVHGDVGGRTFTQNASHCVIAVPLGVLKAGHIAFDPALPQSKSDAIDRLGFGDFEKIAVRFNEPFWQDGGVTHYAFSGPSVRHHYALDLTAWEESATLVAIAGAGRAEGMSEQTLEGRVAALREDLETSFGITMPEPTHVAVSNWAGERESLGAYSYLAHGSSHEDRIALSEPVDGRLCFAGEATYWTSPSTVDGALMSGVREAQRLLGARSVWL